MPQLSPFSASDKVAVVLSGCGVYDGTEIHEAAATLAALTRHGFEPIPCAPQKSLAHVVDHTTGAEASESRKVRFCLVQMSHRF